MPITAPPTIPLITDPSTFSTRAQDWVVWQAEQLYPELTSVSLVLGLSLSGTSVTSNTVGTGSKSFTVETGKGFLAGQSLVIARTSAPTNRMFGLVTSYNSGTGALVFESQAFEGSGTFTDWTISPTLNAVLTAAQVPDGLITNVKLDNGYIDDLTEVPFDNGVDYVPLADGSDSGNKKKALLSASKIQPIAASVAANALTITLNPTTLDFRDATLGSGAVNTRNVPAAISVVVSSGSTLGTVNGIANRLVVLAIDNAGTVELAVANAVGIGNIDETGVISTTAEGGAGAADSSSIIYSTTARSNVPYRVVGFVESTQATAGTWATQPSKIQGAGGLSFQHINQIVNAISVSASGTSTDILNIPDWAKKITISLTGISTNGSSIVQAQLGDSGGIETSGYTGCNSNFVAGVATANLSAGITFDTSWAATYVKHGVIILTNLSDNTWSFIAGIAGSDSNRNSIVSGIKTLTGKLDRIRLTTVGGADTFDGGSFNILIE